MGSAQGMVSVYLDAPVLPAGAGTLQPVNGLPR